MVFAMSACVSRNEVDIQDVFSNMELINVIAARALTTEYDWCCPIPIRIMLAMRQKCLLIRPTCFLLKRKATYDYTPQRTCPHCLELHFAESSMH